MSDSRTVRQHAGYRTVKQRCPGCEDRWVTRFVPADQYPVLPVHCHVCVARSFGHHAHVAQSAEAQARGA